MSPNITVQNACGCGPKAVKTVEPTQTTAMREVYTPPVDIIETPEAVTLTIDLPGVSADAVEIEFEDGALTIRASTHAADPPNGARWARREFHVGDFRRSFRIGADLDTTNVDARLERGVLTVRLPRAERARPRRIAVTASN